MSRSRRPRIPLPRPLRRLAGPLLLLLIWQLLGSLGEIDPRILATPGQVLAAGWELTRNGELASNLFASLQRVAEGLLFGVTAGVVLAVAAGLFRLGEELVDSTMQVLRALPAWDCCRW